MMNKKEILRNWLYGVAILIILISSVISCMNSFNNSVEYETLEKVYEIEMILDNLANQTS